MGMPWEIRSLMASFSRSEDVGILPAFRGFPAGFTTVPPTRQGMVCGILFRLESGYDRQAFPDEASEPCLTGVCFMLHLDPPPLLVSVQ